MLITNAGMPNLNLILTAATTNGLNFPINPFMESWEGMFDLVGL